MFFYSLSKLSFQIVTEPDQDVEFHKIFISKILIVRQRRRDFREEQEIENRNKCGVFREKEGHSIKDVGAVRSRN